MQKETVSRQHTWLLIAILTVGLSLRFVCAFFCELIPEISDQGAYNHFALNWIRGAGLISYLDGTLSAYRPPLYPMFLGIVYVFAGELNYRAVYLVQSVLSLVTIISIYTIARRLFNPRAGLIAASIAAIYPPFVLFDITTMTESVSLVLTTLALALLLKVRSNITRVILVSCCIALGSLCKPAIIFFVPGILVALLLQKATLRDKLTTVSLLLFVLALLLFPWTLRNFLAFNELIPLADNGPVNFYLANNPNATGDCISPSETPLGSGNLPAMIYYREGFRFMLSHPTQYLRLVFKKLLTVLSPDSSRWMLDRLIIPSSQANQRMPEAYATIAKLILHLFSMMVILLGCFGCVLLFQFEQSPLLLPTLSYLLILVLFFFFNIRFRLLSEPAAVVYTGGALSLIISQNPLELYRSYRLRLVGALSTAFIIAVLWISFPLFS